MAIKKSLLIISLLTFTLGAKGAGDEDFDITPEASHFPAMIWVDEDAGSVSQAIADLEQQGVTILRNRGNILLTYIPAGLLDGREGKARLKGTKGVEKIEISKPRNNIPTMDNARHFNNADLIASGRNLPSPFDGEGVVVGVCDIGMDTRHPNFLTADGRECRIRKVVQYVEEQGLRTEYTTPKEIYDWQTDNCDEWHATHVTGIAAGAFGKTDGSPEGYFSLAPKADIVFTASQLSDVGLLAGVEDIIEYAKAVNKPAVINLSMGNTIGPHDGTSLFTQYLDRCADDAIICISAGNDGVSNRTIRTELNDSRKEIKMFMADWTAWDNRSVTEIWSRDDTPFDFSFYLSHNTTPSENIYFETVDFSNPNTTTWRVSADRDDPDFDETFAKIFYEGYVEVTGGYSRFNGRFYVSIETVCSTVLPSPADDRWACYWPGFRLTETEPVELDIATAGGNTFLHPEGSSPRPNNDISFSDLATGERTISVGMMNNTDIKEGAEPGSGNAKGEVNPNSSYATLFDGRKMPLTVAPGAHVVSSISSPYLEANPEEIDRAFDSAPFGSGRVYWQRNMGTSMSCPFVAGAIATWLQAYPELTSEQARQIIRDTNLTSGFPAEGDPRHGEGWFEPYRGLLEVLNIAGISSADAEAGRGSLKLTGSELLVGNPTATPLHIEIYSPSGMLVERHTVTDPLASLSMTHLPTGVYIFRCTETNTAIKGVLRN